MTIEEKAKAYDEALDRCKDWASGAWGHSVDDSPKDIAEYIFPQLAESESEDENIRKEILDFIKHFWADHKESIPRISSWLAWLEKQKEQNPVEYLNKDKVYAIMKKLHDLAFSQRIPIDSDEYKKIGEITSDVRSLLDYPIEQKSIDYEVELKKCKDNPLYFFDKYVTVKLKQKPAEWSEEDEKIRKTLLDYYEEALDNYTCVEWLNGITYGELCDWLKSLRNRPKPSDNWKPSEEQMNCLKFACESRRERHNASVNGDAVFLGLTSLYNNLKKLM